MQNDVVWLDLPTFLGEEVTVGNGSDLETTGHFLAYGIPERVEPFTSPDQTARRTARDIVDEVVREQNGFGYVAHPHTSFFRGPHGEPWDKEGWDVVDDYSRWYPGKIGLELINAGYDANYRTLNRWDSYLSKSKSPPPEGPRVFAIGNSDAHKTIKLLTLARLSLMFLPEET